MSGRVIALGGTLTVVLLLAVLTINVMVRTGIDILVVISLAIVGLIGFGVLGALLNPPEK